MAGGWSATKTASWAATSRADPRSTEPTKELRKALESRYSFQDIVGRSAAMRELFDLPPVVAPHDTTVLILHEAGDQFRAARPV